MDIDSDLEPLTVYNYQVSSALDTLIRHILKTIPESYTEEFPSFSVFEAHSPWGAHVDDERIVICDPSLVDMPKDVTIGIIAHEFAHVFLRHTGQAGLREEEEADRLASEWAFAAEVRAMRQYYGPPTNQRRDT